MTVTVTFDPNSDEDVAYIKELFGEDGAEVEEAPAAKPAKKAAKKAPAPEPEEDEDAGPTMQDAVDKATELVNEGRTADVKGALTQFGVKRVTELSEDQISEFIDALNEESPL